MWSARAVRQVDARAPLVGLEAPTSASRSSGYSQPARRASRARSHGALQLVFQDPFSSLDPRLTAERALREVLMVHHLAERADERRVYELLEMVVLGRRFAWPPCTNCRAVRRSGSRSRAPAPSRASSCSTSRPRRSDVLGSAPEGVNLLRLTGELGLTCFATTSACPPHQRSDRGDVARGRIGAHAGSCSTTPAPPRGGGARARWWSTRSGAGRRARSPSRWSPSPRRGAVPPALSRWPRPSASRSPRALELAPAHRAACHVAARAAGVARPVPAPN